MLIQAGTLQVYIEDAKTFANLGKLVATMVERVIQGVCIE